MAGHALPADALGEDGISEQVAAFERWSRGFEPVAELDHPYIWSDELVYGPPDPRPGWQAQLDGLDLEARRRHGAGFVELPVGHRAELLREHLERAVPAGLRELPFAAEAPHVAIALLAWWAGTSGANDLCHGAAIGRHECRGLPSAAQRPEPLAPPSRADRGER